MAEQGLLDCERRTAEVQPQEQSPATHPVHPDLERALGQKAAYLHCILDQIFALDYFDVRQGRGAGYWSASKCAAEVAYADAAGDLRRGENGADRQPSCEPLGKGEDIRRHPKRLGRAEGAAASHPALDLVENQRGPALRADPPRRLEKRRRASASAGETLHRLHDHGGHSPVHRGVQRCDVIERHLA